MGFYKYLCDRHPNKFFCPWQTQPVARRQAGEPLVLDSDTGSHSGSTSVPEPELQSIQDSHRDAVSGLPTGTTSLQITQATQITPASTLVTIVKPSMTPTGTVLGAWASMSAVPMGAAVSGAERVGM